MFRKRYLVLVVASLAILLSSCFKVEPTIATITVLNSAGTRVPGAEVWLYNFGDGNGNLGDPKFDTIQYTNGSGVASFDFSECYEAGQSGFAVLNIEVTKGTLLGDGIINIEEQKTTDESVIID